MRIVVDARIALPNIDLIKGACTGEIGVTFRVIVTLYGIDIECASLDAAEQLIRTFWRTGVISHDEEAQEVSRRDPPAPAAAAGESGEADPEG